MQVEWSSSRTAPVSHGVLKTSASEVTSCSQEPKLVLCLFLERLRASGPGRGEGDRGGGRAVSMQLIEKSRSGKGKERSFTVSGACFQCAGTPKSGFENPVSRPRRTRIRALPGRPRHTPDGG